MSVDTTSAGAEAPVMMTLMDEMIGGLSEFAIVVRGMSECLKHLAPLADDERLSPMLRRHSAALSLMGCQFESLSQEIVTMEEELTALQVETEINWSRAVHECTSQAREGL